MLTVFRHRLRLGCDLAIEGNGTSGHRNFARHRMLEVEQVTVGAGLFAVEHLLMRRHFGHQDICRRELSQPLLSGLAGEDAIKNLLDLCPMKVPR